MKSAWIVALALLAPAPALADAITYTYTGGDYTHWGSIDPAYQNFYSFTEADLRLRATQFGERLSMSVTFESDTPAINGIFSLFPCDWNCGPRPSVYVTSTNFMSGTLDASIDDRLSGFAQASITFLNGEVTAWNLYVYFMHSCGQGSVTYCRVTSSESAGDQIYVNNGNYATRYGADAAAGIWSLDAPVAVPGPVVGSGLPALLLLSLAGLWRRQKKRRPAVTGRLARLGAESGTVRLARFHPPS